LGSFGHRDSVKDRTKAVLREVSMWLSFCRGWGCLSCVEYFGCNLLLIFGLRDGCGCKIFMANELVTKYCHQ
jgi:hypothetical protein